MKRSLAGLVRPPSVVFAGAGLAKPLDKVVKVGSLGDQSGLYADIGGPGSSVAAQMAIDDSGLLAKGWKIELISAEGAAAVQRGEVRVAVPVQVPPAGPVREQNQVVAEPPRLHGRLPGPARHGRHVGDGGSRAGE